MTAARLLAAVPLLALALSMGACANKQKTITKADTEGVYVDVGGLTYQVQVSRELNARDIEDSAYLKGQPPGIAPLRRGESWFGVFLRVANEEARPARAADDFRIVDTLYEEGKLCVAANGCYRPVPLDPRENSFAYAPSQLDPQEVYPAEGSAAREGVVQGSVLAFRIPYAAYQNRPLELKIESPTSKAEGTVELDL